MLLQQVADISHKWYCVDIVTVSIFRLHVLGNCPNEELRFENRQHVVVFQQFNTCKQAKRVAKTEICIVGFWALCNVSCKFVCNFIVLAFGQFTPRCQVLVGATFLANNVTVVAKTVATSIGKAIKCHVTKLKLFLKHEGIAVARQVLEQNVYKFLRIAVVVMVAMARKDVQKHVATLLVEQVKLSLA